MKQQKDEVLDVNGVVLSNEALEMIKRLQDEDNGLISDFRIQLADIVCLLNEFVDLEPIDLSSGQITNAVKRLITIRKALDALRKP